MAIYNTGRYLDDSINSIINQTIDFKKNIQLILVNDGSIDKSESICLKYKNLYPDNIIYIKLKHGGVSKARNAGIDKAKGKYINFLDPDDKWHYNAFKYVLLFYKFYKNVDLVAGRLKVFELSKNYHLLDYKFYKTRVINLTQEYNCIHQSASSTFFRYSSIKGKHFPEGIFYGEDSRFLVNFLIFKPIIGAIRESIYYYRARADSSSVVQSKNQNIDFYFDTINKVQIYLINLSKTLFNIIIPFIQFYIGYDVLLRIKSNTFNILDIDRFKDYCLLIKKLLNQIEDKYILEQTTASNKLKLFALSKKYNRDLRNDMKIENESLIYFDRIMINMKKDQNIIIWRILDIKDNILHLEGKDNFWMQREKYFYYCKLGNKTYFPKYFEYSNYDFVTMYGLILKGRIVMFDIPLDKDLNFQILSIYISYMDYNDEILTSLGWFSHIPPINEGYYSSENYIIKFNENRFHIYKYTEELEKIFEIKYCNQLIKEKKNYMIEPRKKCIKYKKNKICRKYQIWIVNDRLNQAGDNGEYFFRYLKLKKPKGIKAYFAIEKNCSDYKRLKYLGDILDINSENYNNIFLKTEKIISSISKIPIFMPFANDYKYIKDLLNYEMIFLQQGIIKDDLSNYLHRLDKKFDLFVTSSKKEHKSIFDYKYGYNKKSVILTGLPRYDNLQKFKNIINTEKKIIIIPTWRMNIKGTINILTHKSIHSDSFQLTNFYKFYNSLINDNKILLYMNKYNYTGIFCLHPSFSSQWIDFKQNEYFTVQEICDYQNIILKANLLITDYSSIFFDFGYLRKPVIYTHFDYEDYKKNHYKKGYFDFKKDGFGPICKDINGCVNEIVNEIKGNCILYKKYSKRINKFFTFYDENNSERIFKNIINNNYRDISLFNSNYLIYILFILIILYKSKILYFF